MFEPAIMRQDITALYLGLGLSTLQDKTNPKNRYFDPSFPKPVQLTKRAVGFLKVEVDAWIESQKYV